MSGVIRGGKRVYDSPAGPVIAIQDVGEGNRFTETIEREKSQRTLKQNARHWVLVVPLWQECLKQTRGLVMSEDQVHDMLCRAFIGVIETPYGPVRKESKKLSTAEFAEFDQKCELALIEAWPGLDPRSLEIGG